VTTTAVSDPADTGSRTERTPWWIGAIAGVVATMVGLAAAELVAGLWRASRSPIVSVGDRVVDNVPNVVKDWAIDAFGTSDKVVLLGGVGVLLALFAAAVGVLTVRRGIRAGLVGVAGFTAVGVAASLGRGGGGLAAPVPSLVGGLMTGVALVVLLRRAGLELRGDRAAAAAEAPAPSTDAPSQIVSPAMVTRMNAANRRQFLGTAAGLAVGAAAVGGLGRWLRDRGVAAAQRLKVVLPSAATPLPEPPAGVDVGVAGVAPFFTPNDGFYRIDTALSVPSVDLDAWSLQVAGDVSRPIRLSYDELLARPMIELDCTLACVSNEVGGGLVGNARWLGCRLDDLLTEAGVGKGADQIVGRSVDGFTAGFPTALLDGRDAIVAVGMNGEPLPAAHGFPARLVVPGVYGYVSATKWLAQIELTTFARFEGYWIPRGWAVEGPIKTQSRIDTPRPGARIAGGDPVAIAGVAWAPTRGIARVQVRIDGGEWQDATLGEEYADTTWRQWRTTWTPRPGQHRIEVRATDGDGETQTEVRTPVAPDGASGWHTIEVNAG